VLRETVLSLHEQLVTAFGGASGIRDQGLLDSALARPENLAAYGKPDICDLAAVYAFGVARNHPFVDGNKRVALAVAVLFIELNGSRFAAPEAEAVVQTLGLAARDISESDYGSWLRANTRRRPRRRT
jgi:death-on-curing protein